MILTISEGTENPSYGNKGGTMQEGPNSFLAVGLYLMDTASLDEWADLLWNRHKYTFCFSGHQWVIGVMVLLYGVPFPPGLEDWKPCTWWAESWWSCLAQVLRPTHGTGSLVSSELYLIFLQTWLRSQSSRVQWATNSVSDTVYKWLFWLLPSCQKPWLTLLQQPAIRGKELPTFLHFLP